MNNYKPKGILDIFSLLLPPHTLFPQRMHCLKRSAAQDVLPVKKADQDKFSSITLKIQVPEGKERHMFCIFNSNGDMWQLPCPGEPEYFGGLPSFVYLTGFCNADCGNSEQFQLSINYYLQPS